ncbi:MAG: hypothetical protein ACO20H_12375 [Bacteriovoracaceae bacterium]
MKVIVLILFSFSLFANETHLEKRERIRKESVFKKNAISKCQFKKVVEIQQVMKSRIIPTFESNNIKVESDNSQYFKLSKGVIGLSLTFFKGAALFLPFTVIADIIATPVYAGQHIKELIKNNKIDKKNEKLINESLKKFKDQWNNLALSKIEKLNIINNLRFYQLIKANYDWISDSHGFGEVYVPKEKFSFLYPFIEKHLGKFKFKSNKEVYFDLGKRKKLDLFRYFHISQFSEFLYKNPKLCDISPLAAMDKLGELFAENIKEKTSQY